MNLVVGQSVIVERTGNAARGRSGEDLYFPAVVKSIGRKWFVVESSVVGWMDRERFSLEDGYDQFNVPVWKYLNEHGHTLVRGLSPRTNVPFIHVHLYDCMKDVNCMEVSQEMLDGMD